MTKEPFISEEVCPKPMQLHNDTLSMGDTDTTQSPIQITSGSMAPTMKFVQARSCVPQICEKDNLNVPELSHFSDSNVEVMYGSSGGQEVRSTLREDHLGKFMFTSIL